MRHSALMLGLFGLYMAVGVCQCTSAAIATSTSSSSSGSQSSTNGMPCTSQACGNGCQENGEECDDGNKISGDGCDANCKIEPCYQKMEGESCDGVGDVPICDNMGNCIDRCTNALKDGDEADVDCGGSCPGDCSQGQTCNMAADCQTGYCMDGVCCNNPCDKTCFACNLLGALGTCTPVPNGNPDNLCNANEVCGGGACISTKTANGEPCTQNINCASGQCVDIGMGMKICKQANGSVCADSSVCASGNCTNNLCQP